MAEDKSGRELTPREPADVEATDASLTPVDGESRDVERFSAGPRAHSVGLTEERSAKIVRQSANARSVVFLAILLISLFIPVYWFYENGIPALGAEGRMVAETEAQYVTDVARGYELYIANCAECHGDAGQGGIGPRLNDQGKLYNVLTPAGDPGTGHLNPDFLENVLVVGGRYVCGDPDSLMASWQEPNGPLNYRQVEELIAWLTASQDIVFELHVESHGEADEDPGEPEVVAGWRDLDYEPAPDDTPVPACWKAPNGLTAATDSGSTGGTDTGTDTSTGSTDAGSTPAVSGGTPDAPRQIELLANSALQFTDTSGAQVTELGLVPGETVEFVIDNTAGFDHNFYIGPADVLQGSFAETEVGIPTWQSGVQTLTWTVPEEGVEGLQFACTVPGHYTPMHGPLVTADAGSGCGGTPAEEHGRCAGYGRRRGCSTDRGQRRPTTADRRPAARHQHEATAALQFTGEDGHPPDHRSRSRPARPSSSSSTTPPASTTTSGSAPPRTCHSPLPRPTSASPPGRSGVQTLTWTVPEEGAAGAAVRLHDPRPLRCRHVRQLRDLRARTGEDVAQQALPQGAARRRAAFGLFDADGWTWAGLKATFWFLFIIFMLGVVPNWAYYITTSNTIQVGYNFASIVNLCPADNEDLPCPAPAGAMKPWQASPEELAMPAGRSGSSVFQSGSTVYLLGGTVDGTATDEVLLTEITEDGNLVPWTEGTPLPEPRSDATVGLFSGIPYLMGGYDASGTPTSTVYKGIVEEGVLTGWELSDGEDRTVDLTLPQPLAGAGVVTGSAGFVLVGGTDAEGDPTNGVYLAWTDEAGQVLQPWEPLENLALPEERTDVVAAMISDFVYVVGGEGPEGATETVFRLNLHEGEAETDEAGNLVGWAVAPPSEALPEARTDATTFTSNGAIYVIGGFDADGAPTDSMMWAVPDTLTGDYEGWERLEQTDLPVATAAAPIVGVGAHAFVFGGETPDGATDGSLRAEISPRPPFFQLGIAGATIPGLAIKGEVGQQLGYMNAMGVGMLNFVILIIIGIAFSRPESSKRVIGRILRIKPEPEERYRA